MNVFWVLFLVLLNIIGNQGDPNHGLVNLETGSEDIPPYIVSLRNYVNLHICTGSIISAKWILTTRGKCTYTTHILHGLREYDRFESKRGIQVHYIRSTNTALLIKVEQEFEFDSRVPKLSIPYSSSILPGTGAVIGWSYDSSKRKYVMKRIADVNTTEALSNTDAKFFEPFHWMSGSPLIDGDFIYLLVSHDLDRFYDILPEMPEIWRITNITS